jgi:hypothetical protein
MGVSCSAYYAWLERPQTVIEKDDAELIEIIKTLSKGSKELWYASPQKSLNRIGSACPLTSHWPVNGGGGFSP